MNYIVRLAGPDMDGQAISCLGSQLVELVELLNTREGGLTWGVFNLEPLSGAASVAPDGDDRTWSSDDVVRLGRSKDQFLRGVFVAARLGVQTPSFRSDIDTEDPVDVDLRGAIAEIRAFDTSFFEVITESMPIAEYLARHYGVQVCQQ